MMNNIAALYFLSSATNAGLAGLDQSNQNRALSYQARVAEVNAELARMEGDFAAQASYNAELEARKRGAEFRAGQRVAMAGSGFALSSGTYRDILEATDAGIEADAQALMFGGDLERWRAESRARNYENEADALRASRGSPVVAAGRSIIGSMGNYFAATYDPKTGASRPGSGAIYGASSGAAFKPPRVR